MAQTVKARTFILHCFRSFLILLLHAVVGMVLNEVTKNTFIIVFLVVATRSIIFD